jgi:hypothetical protein
MINGATVTTLLDSGSTHNFLDSTAADRVGIMFHYCLDLQVTVANGDRLTSFGCRYGLSVIVGDKVFHIDCFGLRLGSFDMVLGVQWRESLGPILWDFEKRTMAFIRNGHQVVWSVTELAVLHSLLAPPPNPMEELLFAFKPLFTEPAGLTPP